MNPSESLIIGVVSGVITSALVYLVVNIFSRIIVPWYQRITYRGLNVSGKWSQSVEHNGATDHNTIELVQNEHEITGHIIIVKQYKNRDKIESKKLNISGFFRDGYMMLLSNNADTRFQSCGTFLLKIVSGGCALEGEFSWVDAGTSEIKSRHTVLKREIA